jgi:hypothetical protein
MNALVVYESMYGNTRTIAEAIARGLAPIGPVAVTRIAELDPSTLQHVDMLVIGAPTHVWSLSRPSTRKAAVEAAAKPASGLSVEDNAAVLGVREWLQSLDAQALGSSVVVAAFDTRMKAPLGLSGAASRTIAKRLRRRGVSCVARHGFYVTKQNQLIDGEQVRAESWGAELAGRLAHSVD